MPNNDVYTMKVGASKYPLGYPFLFTFAANNALKDGVENYKFPLLI